MLVYCFIFLLLNSKVNGSSLQNETETIGKCDLLVGQLLSVLTSASDLQGEVNIDSFEKVSSKYTAVTVSLYIIAFWNDPVSHTTILKNCISLKKLD